MLKKLSKAFLGLACILGVAAVVSFSTLPDVAADDPASTTFQVNVKEVLSVSISTPASLPSDSGLAQGSFLRDKVSLSVTSNNNGGFVAGMTAGNSDATLTNTKKSSATIPMLTGDTTRSNFPLNYWGYSLTDTSGGDDTSLYKKLNGSGGTMTEIFNGDKGTGSKDIYFGAKANTATASGTYTGTVIVTVISGTKVLPDQPVDPPVDPPVGPVVPGGDNPSYNSGADRTVYSTRSGSSIITETSEVSAGDNTSMYPQGETNKVESDISSGSNIATILAVTASVAAASGIIFFIVAKRKKDDDEEDEDSELSV